MSQRLDNYIWVREKQDHELEWIRADRFEDHNMPRPLVVINGAFDLLHAGHMRLIFHARELAHNGTLICAMDSDRRIKESKGPSRPILTWVERATLLTYMPLDYLIEIDADLEMKKFLNRVKPDVRVQGGEYISTASKYPRIKKAFVRSTGIHTSTLIERIMHQCKNQN